MIDYLFGSPGGGHFGRGCGQGSERSNFWNPDSGVSLDPWSGTGGEGLRLAVGRDVMQNEEMSVFCVFGREECVGASGHVLASFRCNWFMLGHPALLGVGVLR